MTDTKDIVILAVGIAVVVVILLILVQLDRRGFISQKKKVDEYMEGTVKNGLLHSDKDFKDAADRKSKVLLYRSTLVFIPALIVCLIALIVLCACTLDGIKEWWRFTTFGITLSPTIQVAEVEEGQLYLAFLIPVLNLLCIVLFLRLLYCLQGFIARKIRIQQLVRSGWSGILNQKNSQEASKAEEKK